MRARKQSQRLLNSFHQSCLLCWGRPSAASFCLPSRTPCLDSPPAIGLQGRPAHLAPRSAIFKTQISRAFPLSHASSAAPPAHRTGKSCTALPARQALTSGLSAPTRRLPAPGFPVPAPWPWPRPRPRPRQAQRFSSREALSQLLALPAQAQAALWLHPRWEAAPAWAAVTTAAHGVHSSGCLPTISCAPSPGGRDPRDQSYARPPILALSTALRVAGSSVGVRVGVRWRGDR